MSIVAFHGLLFWLAASGLGRKALETIAPPIETVIMKEELNEDKPPPPPPPPMERPPVEIPPPVVDITIPMDAAPTTAITNVTDKPPPAPTPPVVAPVSVVRVAPTIDRRNSPPTDDYYPPSSKRLGEVGKARVKTCVGENGRIQGDPTLEGTSGFPKLDEAAVKYARAVRFTRGTENGKPAAMCFSWLVTFQLKDE